MGHYRLSQWMIGIISAFLIVAPQIKYTDVGMQSANSIIQSALAVVLLIYSSVLSAENFYHRSKEFFRCGLELAALVGKVDSGLITDHAELETKYQAILSGFDNHETIDSERAWYISQKKQGRRDDWQSFVTRVKIIFGYVYYLPLVLVLTFFFWKFVIPIFSDQAIGENGARITIQSQ